MKYTLDEVLSIGNVLGHLMLTDNSASKAVANTIKGKEEKEKLIDVKVTFNGVEVGNEVLQKLLEDWHDAMEKQVRSQYSVVEVEVVNRVNHILETKSKPVLDKLYTLQSQLESIGDTFDPYWVKEK